MVNRSAVAWRYGLRSRAAGNVEGVAGVAGPGEGGDGFGGESVAGRLAMPVEAELAGSGCGVIDENRDGTVGVFEGYIFDVAAAKRVRLNAIGAGLNEFREVAEGVVLHIAGDGGGSGAGVDGDDAAAVVAAVLDGGAAVLIEIHVPHGDGLAPVAEDVDDLAFDVVAEVGVEVGREGASGALGEVDGGAGVEVVDSVLCVGHVTCIAVEGDAGEILTDVGILQEDCGIFGIVPVVLVAQDAGGGIIGVRVLTDEIPVLVAEVHRAQCGP